MKVVMVEMMVMTRFDSGGDTNADGDADTDTDSDAGSVYAYSLSKYISRQRRSMSRRFAKAVLKSSFATVNSPWP